MDAPTYKPVLFQRPARWESMLRPSVEDFADHILDLMGVA